MGTHTPRRPHLFGSWKVAYADFFTAMMALFLLLWILAQDQTIKQAVERSFKHPFSSPTKNSTGIIPTPHFHALQSKKGPFNSASLVDLAMLRRLNQDLSIKLQSDPKSIHTAPAHLDSTPEGLLVIIFDRPSKPLFETNSAQLTLYGQWVLSTLAWEITRYSNIQIEIEGHTELNPDSPPASDLAWSLSFQRADAARHALLEHGVPHSFLAKIAAYADTQPLPNAKPTDDLNRRVTVFIKPRSTPNPPAL